MTLVDTSVWIDHFRRPDARLAQLATTRSAGIHRFVLGELACGILPRRQAALAYLESLEFAPTAHEAEVLHLVESHRLWGSGLGWVDAHVLAAAFLSGWNVLTNDHRMIAAAARLGIAYPVQ